MIEINKIISKKKVDTLRLSYMEKLTAPLDGYWVSVVIDQSDCYEIVYNNIIVGHFSVKTDKTLVQFCVFDNHLKYSSEIFEYLISHNLVTSAAVSTIESTFLSLCLDYQKDISIEMYLFCDISSPETTLNEFSNLSFRFADENDIDIVIKECGLPFDGYYQKIIKQNQLFVLYSDNIFLGIGEFRISKINSKYADIGVAVAKKYHRKGIGTYIINNLKKYCNKNNVIAIASCDSENIASKKTLEKAGLVSKNRIINVKFK